MRKFVLLLNLIALAACTAGDGSDVPFVSCTNEGQKQFVVDAMRAWYFWNDLLPATVDIGQFETPEEVLEHLTSFSPADADGQSIDRFSFIDSAQADQEFFGEGRFGGFGFSFRLTGDDDLRFTRVFVDSPAYRAGLRRGQQVLDLDGRTIAEIQAAEGISTVFDAETLAFHVREVDGSEFTVSITRGTVTIDPVPQFRIIETGDGRSVGYIELATFVSTADAELDAAFAQFRQARVRDLVLDLRYNGGGLVATANLLGDLLGGEVAQNLLFSKTIFNEQRAPANNTTEFFDLLGSSISLSRLAVIATDATASASELVINSMDPHVEVAIVGDTTNGKPVGQIGLEFCEQILRPTAFQTLNALDFGDYFDGLPATCSAEDDLETAVGADSDPNMIAAMTWFETGACPGAPEPPVQSEIAEFNVPLQFERRGSPEREFADAF